jgi:hypothetical protein
MDARAALVFVLLGPAALGCGKGEELPPLSPARGKVVRGGQSVKGGMIQFSQEGTQNPPIVNGRVGEDGTFTLTTKQGSRSGAGAPVGTYRVIYYPPAGEGAQTDPAKAQAALPVTLPTTYKVQSGENDFTIDLGKAKR